MSRIHYWYTWIEIIKTKINITREMKKDLLDYLELLQKNAE